jgi:hypothetical protein
VGSREGRTVAPLRVGADVCGNSVGTEDGWLVGLLDDGFVLGCAVGRDDGAPRG